MAVAKGATATTKVTELTRHTNKRHSDREQREESDIQQVCSTFFMIGEEVTGKLLMDVMQHSFDSD